MAAAAPAMTTMPTSARPAPLVGVVAGATEGEGLVLEPTGRERESELTEALRPELEATGTEAMGFEATGAETEGATAVEAPGLGVHSGALVGPASVDGFSVIAEGTTVCDEGMAPGSPASPAPPEVGEGEAEASSDSEGEGDLGSVGEAGDPRKVADSLLGEGRDGEDWCELRGDA